MADIKRRYKDNVAGRFFVDENCIYCGLCAAIAPNSFKLSSKKDHDIVYKQPENDVELANCQEAKSVCPVDAIGDSLVDIDDPTK
ncbi:MAG: ferredoxin [SAR324 cluster bacterium]|nr:ferredoxin [SAR324 cluster bacterium]